MRGIVSGGSVSSASRARTRLNIEGRSRWAMRGLDPLSQDLNLFCRSNWALQ